MSKMIEAMTEAESFDADLQLTILSLMPNLTDLSQPPVPGNLIVSARGDVQFKTLADAKIQADVHLEEKAQGQPVALDSKLLYSNKKVFLNLQNAPELGGIDLLPLKNNWYKLDLNTVLSEDSALTNDKIDAKKEKALRKLFAKTKFLQLVADKGVVALDGRAVYDYQVKLNKEAAAKFFKKSTKIIDNRDLTELEIADMQTSLSDWEQATAELWIGKNDYLLYKTALKYEVGEEPDKAVYDVVLRLDSFDKQIDIQYPVGVRDFDIGQFLFDAATVDVNEADNGDILK